MRYYKYYFRKAIGVFFILFSLLWVSCAIWPAEVPLFVISATSLITAFVCIIVGLEFYIDKGEPDNFPF